MPWSYRNLPSAAQVRARCKSFMQNMNYHEIFRFKATVRLVARRIHERWNIAIGDGAPEVFEGVLVCNGPAGHGTCRPAVKQMVKA
jgi:hypothetical protein